MKVIYLTVAAVVLSGCATHSRFNKTGAGMMAWDNNLSAAFVVPAIDDKKDKPKLCMQMAMSINDLNYKATASLSEAALKIFEKIPKDAVNASNDEILKISSEFIQTAKALQVSTERTSFLQVGGFYLCQFQANGMSEANVSALAATLINSAASIGVSE